MYVQLKILSMVNQSEMRVKVLIRSIDQKAEQNKITIQ